MNRIMPLLALAAAPVCAFAGDLKLHRLFQDHMVVQRDREILVRGWASSGASVEVALTRGGATESAKTVAGQDGAWSARLPAQAPGAPAEFSVSSGAEKLHVGDVLVGDVWLLSGQSNMEWKIGAGISGPDAEPQGGKFPQIRTFIAAKRCGDVMEADFDSGQWSVCSDETVKGFSAVGFYFARRITTEIGIPIGLVEADWGGSSVEAWMLPELLAGYPHRAGTMVEPVIKGELSLKQAGDLSEGRAAVLVKLVGESYEAVKAGATELAYDDSKWDETVFPRVDELPREVNWLRKNFDWSKAGEAAVLDLGTPNSHVAVYLNGRELARIGDHPAVVKVPEGVLKAGRNVLALRVTNPWWFPSMKVNPDTFGIKSADGATSLSLLEGWRINSHLEPKLPIIWSMQQVNSALYRGMLAPIVGFNLRGVLWYQGESNWDNPVEYASLFPAMIQDWRVRFAQGYLPFYFVQLANLGKPTDAVEDKSWGWIRDGQAAALKLPHTGMAMAIDVGDAYDIHPHNKVTVGERLARHALKNEYGRKDLAASGPSKTKVTFLKGEARVELSAGSALRTADGAAPRCFSVAGADRVWHVATARIEGSAVVLKADGVAEIVAVRYAWAGNPTVNLTDSEGLPTVPFRTDDWPSPFTN